MWNKSPQLYQPGLTPLWLGLRARSQCGSLQNFTCRPETQQYPVRVGHWFWYGFPFIECVLMSIFCLLKCQVAMFKMIIPAEINLRLNKLNWHKLKLKYSILKMETQRSKISVHHYLSKVSSSSSLTLSNHQIEVLFPRGLLMRCAVSDHNVHIYSFGP